MASPRAFDRALVTGASAGIGEAFARELAARKRDLVLVARSGDKLQALADELSAAHGVAVEVLPADLTTDEGLEATIERLLRVDAPIDLLINNAGFGTIGQFADMPIEGELEEIALNVTALVRLTHAALPGFADREGGILNVSSLSGFQPGPGSATYAATKAYVVSFSQAVHEEAKASGVYVTVLCPGFTRTDFQSSAGYDTSWIPDALWQSAEDVAVYGLRAISRNTAVAIPGAHNRATARTSRMLPATVVRKVVAKLGA